MIQVLGIGTGLPGKLTLEGFSMLQNSKQVILQTAQVPLAAFLSSENIAYTSLDPCYDAAEDFDDFVQAATEFILSVENATLCLVGDLHTNTLLQHLTKNHPVELHSGVGFFSTALDRAMEQGDYGPVMLCTATQFLAAQYTGDTSLVITEVGSAYLAAEVSSYLLRFYPPEFMVSVVCGDSYCKQSLYNLQNHGDFGYDTSLVLPPPNFEQKQTYSFGDFCSIVAKLRSPQGCPWDREQTHKSLRPNLIEECYEAVDAIDLEDPAMLADELGDVLLQIVLHAEIASEHGEFDILDVCNAAAQKMVRRHPHVFSDEAVADSAEVLRNWEEIKKAEKQQQTIIEMLGDIPRSMSALLRAQKLQKKAASFGFDWPDHTGPLEKVHEELAELLQEVNSPKVADRPARMEAEAGDVLFAVVNLARKLGVDAETALLGASSVFIRRVAAVEQLAEKQGKHLDKLGIDAREALWQAVKCEESM